MGNQHDDTINSEQEDLVGSSSSELDDGDDDDITDGEGIQFNLCKTGGPSLSLTDTPMDWNTSAQDYQNAQHQHQQQLIYFKKCKRTFLLLILYGLGLLIASFSLFIAFPLYQKQMEIGSQTGTVYGSILFISPVVTILLIIIAWLFSWLFKWNIKLYKFPMPIKRLLVISLCCGIAGTLCTVSSYQRVPCHLQDPLKGAALVYSLIFYFFFCKKVMGLQKIFSATTAVVGLFISVDYGLCDEFRCHGNDTTGSNKVPAVGWQGRAFWTLLYVTGITLWTLHLSLLEGNLVMLSMTSTSPQPNNLLTTISRLVSNSDRSMDERYTDRQHQPKIRPKPAHLAAWIHLLAFGVIIVFGIIDVAPGTGVTKTFTQHWINTGDTFVCHFNVELKDDKYNEELRMQQTKEQLDYLSNLTPGSILYNKTVQKLRRTKRSMESRHFKYFHRRIGHHILDGEHMQFYTKNHSLVHLNKTMFDFYYNRTAKLQNAFKKYKNFTSTQTPLISRLIINSDGEVDRMNCRQISTYSWMIIGIYIVFILLIFHFLDISESAVFTLAIITAALPLVGLFWSAFKLEVTQDKALIIWSPSISGELICSLLGTPIVFLGLILLYRAHFSDILRPSARITVSNPYTSLHDA